jgi:hypothetical protein
MLGLLQQQKPVNFVQGNNLFTVTSVPNTQHTVMKWSYGNLNNWVMHPVARVLIKY